MQAIYVTEMVTSQIRPPMAYLRLHRKARKVRVVDIAKHMGIERESVYRLERKAVGEEEGFVDVNDIALYAEAIGEPYPLLLFFPPGQSSIDAMMKDQPQETWALAADIVRRLIAQ